MQTFKTFRVNCSGASWRVTFDNPPINLIDGLMYDEMSDLMNEIEADPALKTVVFDSAHHDFYLAHYSAAGQPSRSGVPPWIDVARRLALCGVISIAVVRGRARGAGSEFALACDMRFASLEKAVFGQPEVGLGLLPGGGSIDRLSLLVGRARAIEIVLAADDFDALTAERYGWINRALPDAELDAFVSNLVRRVGSFDVQALRTAKSLLNQSGLPDEARLRATQDIFFGAYGWEGARERAPRLRELGWGQPGDFELRVGPLLADLKR
jgi:enoyl-CoA hydratase/carnithine racemase